MDESEQQENETKQEKPDSIIRQGIFDLTRELHRRGHTRKEIVHHLREVADTYEDFWKDKDSYNKSPSEKDVTLPGDYE